MDGTRGKKGETARLTAAVKEARRERASSTSALKQKDAELRTLRAELDRARTHEYDLNETRTAMLNLLEDLEESRRKIERARYEWSGAFDAVKDPIFLHDKDFRIVRANHAYAERAGKDFKDIIGTPYWEVFPEGTGPFSGCVQAPLEKGEEGEEGKEEEITLATGEVFVNRAFSIRVPDGTYLHSIHILEDITERKRAERALRQSEKFLAGLLDGMLTFVGVLEADGKVIFVNNTPLRTAGIKLEDVKGKTFYDTFWWQHSDEASHTIKNDIEKCAAGETVIREIEVRMAAGRLMWIEFSMHPILDEEGRVKYLIPEGRDITERKLAEVALRESEEKFRAVSSSAQDAILMVNGEGKIAFWNEAAERMFGYSKKEAQGEEVAKLIVPDRLRQNHEQGFAKFVMTGRGPIIGKVLELPVLRKDGSEFCAEHSISSVKLNGQWHAIGLIRDITERKEAEGTLRKVNRALRTLSRCNEALVHARDEAQLLADVCRVLVEEDGYHLAWVGYAERDEAKTVRPVAEAGFETGYLKTLNITWADEDRGGGPTGIAIRTGKPHIARDILNEPCFVPWRQAALERGYRSSIALPLETDGEVLGALNIYAIEPNAFDTEELKLLQELADDLSYGVVTLRMRIERSQAVQALRTSEERLKLALEGTNDGLWDWNVATGGVYFSPRWQTMLGYEPGEVESHLRSWEKLVHPDDIDRVMHALNQHLEGHTSFYKTEHRVRSKSGEWIWILDRGKVVERNEEGRPLRAVGTHTDITGRKRGEEALRASEGRLKQSLEGTIGAVAKAVEVRDPYTAGHQRRVGQLACAIAKEMGLEDERIEGIHMGAMIHDIGKIYVPAEILNRPGRLTDTEFDLVKSHPQVGYDIVGGVEFPWPVADMILQHHERLNGSGYPQALKGDKIVIEARILGVADVVEAMASHRPYRPGLGVGKALAEIQKNRGKYYDPTVVDTCVKLFEEKDYRLED